MSAPFYFGWAAIAPDDASPPNFVHVNSVRDRRSDAQDYIGSWWMKEGENPWQGWRRAYRKGWRCRRVAVRIADGAKP